MMHVFWLDKDTVLLQSLLRRDVVPKLVRPSGEENRLEMSVGQLQLLSVLFQFILFLEEVSFH